MQPLDLRDDHRLCRHPCGIVGRQAGGDLLQVLEPHGDMKPIQDRRSDDAGIGKNAAKARATIGEGGHRRVLGSADGIEVAADQLLDVGIGADDSAENLAATRRRFDIADPHLKMPLTIRTAADKGQSKLTMIVGAAVRGLAAAQFRSASPVLRVWRRKVSWSLPASTGNICSNTSAAVR